MYESRGKITLRSGEQVDFGVVHAPDAAWRERVVGMFVRKGVLWQWQNDEALRSDIGVNARYFLLHRDGQPFANVMLTQVDGIGMLGHVWTAPQDRGQGASSLLVSAALDAFRAAGGQAMFLETGYPSTAYRIYERIGFHSLEPMSRHMEYYAASKRDFDTTYFALSPSEIVPLAWRHWVTSQPLFAGDFPGLVRCAGLQLIGRQVNDEYIIPLISEDLIAQTSSEADNPPRARVLVTQTGAVLGFALWSYHPLWPDCCIIDLFCHPDFRDRADALLDALTLPSIDKLIAYADERDTFKLDLLRRHGFAQTAVLPQRIAVDAAKSASLDVLVLEKA